MPRSPKPKPSGKLPRESSTAAKRVCGLIDSRFGGSRRAFAEAAGVSHTAIIKISNGQQPGRRLMESLTKNLKLNAAWLLNGEGEPFAEPQKQPGIPIARKMLPGAPQNFSELLQGDWIDDTATLFTPSQYWLLLTSDQPILRNPHLGFRSGDLLLLETDRSKFPRERHLSNQLCVVRCGDPGSETYKLGAVNFIPASEEDGPQRLELDCFDQDADPATIVIEEVYRHLPSGQIVHKTRKFTAVKNSERTREMQIDPLDIEPALPAIRHSDIVSVWLQHLRRPTSTPL